MTNGNKKKESDKPKQPETSELSFWFAVVGFVALLVLVFFKLLETPGGVPWAWGGLAFAVFFVVSPDLGGRVLVGALVCLTLYGAFSIFGGDKPKVELDEDLGPGFMYRER